MGIHDGPQWRLASFDPVTRDGTVRGVGVATFSGAVEDDFLPDERVFVSLAEMGRAQAIWPAVAHRTFESAALPALRELAQSLPQRPEWAARATAVFEALPYPLHATVVDDPNPRLLAFELDSNAYTAWGADVSIQGELVLKHPSFGAGTLPSGPVAGRVATPIERAWLAKHGHADPEAMAVVLAAAGQLAPGPYARSTEPALCVVSDLEWQPHRWQECSALEAKLDERWNALGAPTAIRALESGQVYATFSKGDELLGEAEWSHARRWALAFNQLSKVSDT